MRDWHWHCVWFDPHWRHYQPDGLKTGRVSRYQTQRGASSAGAFACAVYLCTLIVSATANITTVTSLAAVTFDVAASALDVTSTATTTESCRVRSYT